MTLLSIFEFGIGWLALLTLAFLAPAAFLFWQANRESKQRTARQVRPLPGQPIPDTDGAPIKIYNLWTFRLGAVLVIAWVIALLMIRSDYAHRTTTPVEKLNDGRLPAEDMLKK